MSERSSPNKVPYLGKGIFSSLSGIYKQKSSPTIQSKGRTSPSSSIRSERSLASSRSSPMKARKEESSKLKEEVSRLSDSVKQLSSSYFKEKKRAQVLDQQLKEAKINSTKTESLQLSLEKAQRTIEKLKLSQQQLIGEKDTARRELNTYKERMAKAGIHLETLGNVLVDVVDNIVRPLLESVHDEKGDLLDSMQAVIVEEFVKVKEDTLVDLGELVEKTNHWSTKKDLPKQVDEITYKVDYLNHTEYAVTLYDFEGECEGDLAFKKGEIIEVIEEKDSGWWIGRLGKHVGAFPYNFVQVM